MLTSHKVTEQLPFQVSNGQLPEQGLPQARHFSEVFASVLAGTENTAMSGRFSETTFTKLEKSDLSALGLDIEKLQFSDLKNSELSQILPPGLQKLAAIDAKDIENMLSSKGFQVTEDDINAMSVKDVVGLLASTTSRDEGAKLINDVLEGFDATTIEEVVQATFSTHSVEEYLKNSNQVSAKSDPKEFSFNIAEADDVVNATKVDPIVRAVEQATTSSQGAQVTPVPQVVQPSASGSAAVNYQTSWGAAQGTDGNQVSANQTNSNGQSFNQGQSFQGQSFQGQQQLAQQQMAQMQEQRNQAFEQQMALKNADDQMLKADVRDPLLSADLGASERRAQLPLGLQAINVPVKSQQWSQSFAHRITFMANNNIQQAQISLNPEKLGPIQVKLQMDRDQQVHVTMVAQHGTTREAIESAMPRLREMLEQSGLNLASVDVSDQKQFAEQGKEEQGSEGVQGLANKDLDGVEEDVSSSNTVVTDNIVDYYA